MSNTRFPSRLHALAAAVSLLAATQADAAPKVVLISLDGAEPARINQYLKTGVLPQNQGLGLLKSQGVMAKQNITVSPSLTAVSHIAIATGSTAAKNDIPANSFHPVASPFTSNISGFGAPIGGYSLAGPTESPNPTAEPLWVALRAAGKKVVAATWPGADGATINAPGITPAALIQSAANRTVDYAIPFGAFAGPTGTGFTLHAANFSPAPQATLDQLAAAGRAFYGQVMQKTTALESFTSNGVGFSIQVAALDTVDDHKVIYDTLVFFDSAHGIQPGPFALPATGPAYVKARDKMSAPFFLEGTPNRAGTAFYVTYLDPKLKEIRLVRYSANFIPRNAPVLANVDDANNNVGYWANQSDFRFTERLAPGVTASFTDKELEAVFEDQVRLFVDYQTRMVLRAIDQNPDADLVMAYIEQPDGSNHQFMLTDDRQASNPLDPNSIGAGQDFNKKARYAWHLKYAYQKASEAVQKVIDKVGVDATGKPNSNVFVVSDHGFAPFHTAVNLSRHFANLGIDTGKVRIVSSGPAVNIYINLQGREPNGTVGNAEYVTLLNQVEAALWSLTDNNPTFAKSAAGLSVFDQVNKRPVPADINDPSLGRTTNALIGQDSGDIYALLHLGYNFDGTQSPVVQRQGDAVSATPVLSVPNFYGAHGYAPEYPAMSATFIAAGPDIGTGKLPLVHNIDVAPTILGILGVTPAATVEGKAIKLAP